MQPNEMPVPVTRTAREVFGVLDASTPLQGFDKAWNTALIKTPGVKKDYVWDVQKLKVMIAFFLAGGTALKLIGQTGTGKTEYVTQFHAALNLPLFFITANPKMEAYHLLGREIPTQNGMEWRDGPLLAAARQGLSILIDEYNVLDPGEATGLNAFLEGRPYTVPDTGETVVPAPGFRVFATVNPKAFGYSGRNTQDLANDDRFVDLMFEYPEPEVEEKQVVDLLMKLRQPQTEAENIAKVVVKCANAIRSAFMGESDAQNALPFTMSRRGVMEWAKWTLLSKSLASKGQNPLFYALDMVLGNRQDKSERLALHSIVELGSGQTSG
ncbi:MAG: AAA family ATPase [Candidatus Methylomirabilaceae bacterium]